MTSPAEELRAAAKLLRETAANATPGPWENCSTAADGIRPRWILGAPADPDDGWASQEVVAITDEMAEALADITEPDRLISDGDTEWIALASPALAEPLAALLGSVADAWPRGVHTATQSVVAMRQQALTVARALLGTTS